jgi:hypothetical protein
MATVGFRRPVLLPAICAGMLIVFGWAGVAHAQTGPDLLVRPWVDSDRFDSSTDALLENTGHTDSSTDIRLSIYHSEGRYRLFPDSVATPRFGYDATYLDIDTNDRSLPRHLENVQLGFAQPVARIGTDGFLAITAAEGYAGNSTFTDSHAWYTSVNIIGGRQFANNKDEALLVALNFDQNRTFMPDIPIPGFAFANRYNAQLTYVLGVPYSSITYEPITGLQLEGGWELLQTFDANIGYAFTKHFELFGRYNDELDPFHIKGQEANTRIFFETHQVEAGIRYSPVRQVRLSASAGYAFGQEFTHGFDSRNLVPIRHIGDEPFVHLRVDIAF